MLESLRSVSRQMFPFNVYHSSAKPPRHYTLYATSEALRKTWYNHLVDAIGVHKARSEANMVRSCLSYSGHVKDPSFFPNSIMRRTS